MKKVFSLLLLLLLLAGIAHADSPGDTILGLWYTTDNKSVVKIFTRDHKYFGQVMSIGQPNFPADDKQGMGGKPRTDRENPNPALRDHPVVGLEFMSDFKYAGKNLWNDGKIYDPEIGKSYKCKMTLLATNRLEVRGYVGISLFGRTVTWTR